MLSSNALALNLYNEYPSTSETMEILENKPAGWYRDPEDYQFERFWNGTSWTSARRPIIGAKQDRRNQHGERPQSAPPTFDLSAVKPFMPGNSTMDRGKNDDLFASGLYVALISSAVLALVYAVGMDDYIPGGPYGHPLLAILSIAIVPQIFYRLAGRRFSLSRHHALVMSNFVLWMQIVYVFKFFLDIGISSFWQRWNNFVGPGFLLEMLWWTHLILNFRAGHRQAKKKTEFRASLTPWLLGSLQQSFFQTPVSSGNLSVPVRPQTPSSLKDTQPARPSQVAGTSSTLPPKQLQTRKRVAIPKALPLIALLGLVFISVIAFTISRKYERPSTANPLVSPSAENSMAPVPANGYKVLSYLVDASGSTSRWNSCKTIEVVLNTKHAPIEAETLTKIAIKNVEQATGLNFEIVGNTAERYSNNREPYQPGKYPSKDKSWAPVLLDWEPADEFQKSLDQQSKDAVGLAFPQLMQTQNSSIIVTGAAQFDATWFKKTIADGNVTGPTSVIMHELGHIMGLDHVTDKKEIMNPVENGFTAWGPRDRAGLEFMGSGPCQEIKPD